MAIPMAKFDFSVDWADLIPHIIEVVIIVAVVLLILFVIRRTIPKIMAARIPRIREESPDELSMRAKTLSSAVIQILSAVVWTVALVMILSELGVDIGPLLAIMAVAVLALGFAAQNIIRDFLHGFFILMEDWYRVGEVATIAGIGGVVDTITLRRTILRDLNGTMHVIPNSKVDLASNMTRDWARINLDISVAYKENLNHVFSVINQVCQELKDDPIWGEDLLTIPHVERVDSLGDNGIDIKILGDTKSGRQWALSGELRKRLKERFDEENIEIPWPHTKVYFANPPSGV